MSKSTFTLAIAKSYRTLNSFYLTSEAMGSSGISPGKVTVLVENQPEITAEGTLNSAGWLSGMSRVYTALGIEIGDTLSFSVPSPTQIVLQTVQKSGATKPEKPKLVTGESVTGDGETESVFRRQRLKPIHIEVFSPENLRRWEPENEPDVYMVFGLLQEYTAYRYCCATSKALLTRLGFAAETKPDAILVDDNTGEYLIAEFKMTSSSFTQNHKRDDVDVLVVWHDDEADRTKLPRAAVCLKDIARTAAQELLKGD